MYEEYSREEFKIEKYWLWLMNIENMSRNKIYRIMEVFKNPEEVFRASEMNMISSKVISDDDIVRIKESKKSFSYDNELQKLRRINARFISIDNEEYPNKLRNIYDYPYGLFIRGNVIYDNGFSIAIVGARNCSEYGKSMARRFAGELSRYGIPIISGMARGIDSYSHRGVVESGGSTYGVLGCGVDICYPAENIELFTDIQMKGSVISEYPLGCAPMSWQFPARNRIISGLADIILVVEAREKSGSLITVEHALEQGKDIFAVPGRIGDKLSEGCNRLIRAGAGIALSPEMLIEEISDNYFSTIEYSEKKNYPIAKDLEVVYSNVDLFPKSIQTIIEESSEKSDVVLEKLLRLQLMNLVNEPIKGYYSRNI